MLDLQGKRVLVMGLGVHGGGLGVTKWLVKQGALVTVTDLKSLDELRPSLDDLSNLPIQYHLGEHREQDFANADLIVRNPGVPRESRFLQIARDHNVPIEMEMGLFFERLPRGGAQAIGITGTKGKTTTTLMVGAMLKSADPKTVVAGNLRVSALDLLDKIDLETPVVLELSSWQLEAFETHPVSPHIVAITNISADHLNRYASLGEYAEAKAIIFRHQHPNDFSVLNFDNRILTQYGPRITSKLVWTSAKRNLTEGAFRDRNALVWRWAGKREKIIDATELRVPGTHNVENALVAIAVASLWGAAPDQVAEALKGFRGVEHRQELVRDLRGVRWINDTTATAPAATIAAIQTFAPTAHGIVLIAGGSDKNLDYEEMAQVIKSNVRKVIMLQGTATEKIERALVQVSGKDLVDRTYDDLQRAVERARDIATEGEVVLLSPGCASFGMFANEFERGDKFRELVNQLT
jgi:UDP-N-acetylmuramoylalanine--D-glutamate ligase